MKPVPGWAGKMSGFALRLAGLLHIAEYATNPLIISESTMQNALALARALGDHALAAFNLMGWMRPLKTPGLFSAG